MFLDLTVGPVEEPFSGRRWDPPEILRRVEQRAALYAGRGLAPTDRVFLHYGNTLEFFVDLLAVWRLGACAVPVDARLTPFEVENLVRVARPRMSVWLDAPDSVTAARLAALRADVLPASELGRSSAPPEERATLDADALILFTSGTTGQPKGVVHTHRSLRAQWTALHHKLGTTAYRRTLCLLPTHFGHGLICNCLFPWFAGQHLLITPPFRPDTVMRLGALLDDCRVTFLSSVPSVWRLALKMAKPPETGTLERVSCGSAPLSAALWRAIQDWAGTTQVWNAYGITETGSWLAGTSVPRFEPADGLIGEAWGGIVKVLHNGSTEVPLAASEECEPGESGYVWVNTPALMRGYFERDDLTRKVVRHGWFLTGDIGVRDDRGYLYLKGREREEINKGGMKVYPGDIDAVAERFQAVVDVCTFAYQEPLHGEDIGIAVVLRASDRDTVRALYEWMGVHLPKHKLPRRWYVLEEIPRTSRGKINREDVARRCEPLAAVDLPALLGGHDS